MSRLIAILLGLVLALAPNAALAEGAGGGYRGIATMYYTLIAVILIYGVKDVFGKKVMYVVGPIIAIGMYILLPQH